MGWMRKLSQTPFPCPMCHQNAAYEWDNFDSSSYTAKVIVGMLMILGGIAAGFFCCVFWLIPVLGMVLLANLNRAPVIVRHCSACNYRW